MTRSRLHLNTTHGSRYLQQLGKHFSHKVHVTFTPTEGQVELPFGICKMAADDAAFSIVVSGEPEHLPRLEQFIADHLSRFAFRENPILTRQRAA